MTSRARHRFSILTGPLLILAALTGGAAFAADETVATVDGKPITRAELEKALRPQLIEIDNQRYQVLEQGLHALIAERLLAREAESRGVTVTELRKVEIVDKLATPTEEEVKSVYEENKGQIGDATFDDVHDRIVEFLKSQQAMGLEQELVARLSEKYETEIKLEPPVVKVAIGSGPPRGGKPGAPVTIVAFSDYECPYCRRGEEVVEKVLAEYGDKVVYYHRDYPLPFHPNARRAAEAARCAGEQDRYWDYHVMLFTGGELSDERFAEIAEALGVDRSKFDECLASGRFEAVVDADMEAAAELGVNGTPAFFVNGRMLTGAQPLESFKVVIDSELARNASTATQ